VGLYRPDGQAGLDHGRPVTHDPQAQSFFGERGDADPVILDLEDEVTLPPEEANLSSSKMREPLFYNASSYCTSLSV
jgi:hypothetical protein